MLFPANLALLSTCSNQLANTLKFSPSLIKIHYCRGCLPTPASLVPKGKRRTNLHLNVKHTNTSTSCHIDGICHYDISSLVPLPTFFLKKQQLAFLCHTALPQPHPIILPTAPLSSSLPPVNQFGLFINSDVMTYKNGATPEFMEEHYSTIVLKHKPPKEPNNLPWEAHS